MSLAELNRPQTRKGRSGDLLPVERVFCAEYMANGVGSLVDAAMIAWPNQKKTTATVSANNVLKKPTVVAYLQKMIDAKLSKTGLATERLLRHLETALFLDPADLFEMSTTRKGSYVVKSLEDIPKEVRQCITELKCRVKESWDEYGSPVEETFIEFRLINKDKALEMAMKYRGLLADSGVSVNIQQNNRPQINFDQLCSPEDSSDSDNTVEGHIVHSE